jgi:hypothetical protein
MQGTVLCTLLASANAVTGAPDGFAVSSLRALLSQRLGFEGPLPRIATGCCGSNSDTGLRQRPPRPSLYESARLALNPFSVGFMWTEVDQIRLHSDCDYTEPEKQKAQSRELGFLLESTGVADGTRTHDDRNHNPGLYQLSYGHH